MPLTDYSFTTIDGNELPAGLLRGKVVLLVNVASECGFTPQYHGLQQLHRRYHPRGLTVLAIPCNDFGGQEPGSDQAIQAFCLSRYDVEFPVSRKEAIIGNAAHPVFRWIADQLGEDQLPRWNFHKYLFDREGNLADAWPSRVDPLSTPVVSAIETALA